MQPHQVQSKQDAQALDNQALDNQALDNQALDDSGPLRSRALSSASSKKLPLQTYRTNDPMSTTPAQNAAYRSGLFGSGRVNSGKVSGAVTGVAAVASAGIAMPMVAEGAIAYEMPSGESIVPQAYQTSLETDSAAGYQQAMAPQVAQTANRSVFKPGYSVIAERSFGTQVAGTLPINQSSVGQSSGNTSFVDVASQSPVLGKDADGNWTVSYTPRQGYNTQAVVAQVAQSASSGKAASSGQYISAQLPDARRKVTEIQQKIRAFEAEYGQADLKTYQRLLNSRIDEISQQRVQLRSSLEETRKVITQLKMQLVTVNADLSLAEQVIAQDMAYQTVWQRLQKSEEALLTEFSKASFDSEALNGTYSDYQYHQQWLQRTVQEALSNYLMAEGSTPPDFIYRAPAALNIMQDLVVATHEYQVQQLRQSTITTIEQRLQARQTSLIENIGEYEALQRELATAQQVLNKYEAAGNSSVVQAAIDPNISAVERAKTLSLEMPGGSVGKALLGIVAAGGTLATVLARRRRSTDVFKPTVLSIAPHTGSSNLALYGNNQYGNNQYGTQAYGEERRSIAAAQAAMVAQQPQLAPVSADQQNPMEANLLHELLTVTGRPAPTLAMTAGLLGGDSGHGFEGAPKLLNPAELSVTKEPTETLSTETLSTETPATEALATEALATEALATEALATEALATEALAMTWSEGILTENMADAVSGTDDIMMAEMVTAMTTAVAADNHEIIQLDDVLTDDDLSVEQLVHELDATINQAATTEENFSEEVRSRAVEPVQVSLDEIDLFAEQAIRWVLKDLGYVPSEPAMEAAEVKAIDAAEERDVQRAEQAKVEPEAEPVDELSELERTLSEVALSELPAPTLPSTAAPITANAEQHGRYAFPPRSILSKRDGYESSEELDEAIAKAYAESWETVSVG